MTGDINATTEDVYWILWHTDGTIQAGTTPVGCVTTFSPTLWTVSWQGTNHDEWVAQCKNAGIDRSQYDPDYQKAYA